MRLRFAFFVTLLGCSNPDVDITFAGTGAGAIRSSAGKECTKSCRLPFGSLTATPNRFSAFSGWSGAGCSGTGECLPKTETAVTATFEAVAWPVTVTISGEGTVSTGTETFSATTVVGVEVGQTINLVAAPAAGWLLARWEALCVNGATSNRCELTPKAPIEVVAVFEKGQSFEVVVDGQGTVDGPRSIGNCTTTCEGIERVASLLRLRATPSATSTFAGWSNECGMANPCEVTLRDRFSVTATFRPSVTLRATGDGTGRISGPMLRGCESLPCTVPWDGRPIVFTAVAEEDSRVAGFVGCPRAAGSTCTIDRFVSDVTFGFDRVVTETDQLIGDVSAIGPSGAFGDVDHLWILHSSPVSFRGATSSDAGLSLLQVNGAAERFLVTLPSDALVQSAARPDGGTLLLVSAVSPVGIGALQLSPGSDALVALSGAGAVDWSIVVANAATELSSIAVSRTGEVWLSGYVDGAAPPLVLGADTIAPLPIQGMNYGTAFVAGVSSSGQILWARPALRGGRVRVFDGPVGPTSFGYSRLEDFGDNTCGAPPTRPASSSYLSVAMHQRDGGCTSSIRSDTAGAFGSTPEATGAVSLPNDILLLVFAESSLSNGEPLDLGSEGWLLARYGASYGALNAPRQFSKIDCGASEEFRASALGRAEGDEVALTGHGACVLGIAPTPGVRRAFAARWNLQQRGYSRAWQFPVESSTLASSTASTREAVLWVSVTSPFSLGGKQFTPPSGGAYYRLRVRP